MTLELLLAQFDGLIQTPADVEKLNATILQWAVQGRLVPQCEEDDAASFLLEHISSKKKQLIKEGYLRKGRRVQTINEEGIPFKIPQNWMWTRLNDVYDVRDGTHDTPKYVDQGVPLITSKNLNDGKLDFSNIKYISLEDHQKIALRSNVEKDDILFAMIGSIGNPVIVEGGTFSIKNVALFKYYDRKLSCPEYLFYFLRFAEKAMKETSSGAVQSFVSLTFLRSYLMPLPPLAEQKRIVARVDELLGQTAVLTQQLESVHEQRRGVHTAVLHQLTQPANQPTEVFPLLSRNFDRLYVDANTIAELKQAILQLAVQGRLVPQDEGDEDAAVLLEQIKEEKKVLISQTEGREENAFISLSNGEFTHPLPNNWKWTKVGEVCPYIVPNRDKPKSFTGDIPWITLPDFDDELYLYGSKEGLGLTKEEVNKYRARTVPAGSVIMSCIGRFGITGILKQDSVINQQLHAFLVPKSVDARYLVYALRTQTSYMESQATSTTILYLNKSKCNSVPFPLPPFEEQRRIVAKVDKLFALCDQLVGQVTAAENGHQQLLEAVLAQAT